MHIFVENFPDLIDKKHHIFLQALSPSVGVDGRACAGSVAVRQIASAMLTKQNKHPARLPMSERSLPLPPTSVMPVKPQMSQKPKIANTSA